MPARSLIETLEPRRLFSGNLAVAVDSVVRLIKISGDSKDNAFTVAETHQLVPTPPPSRVIITSYIITGLNGTTVNGAPSLIVATQGTHSFDINTGAGADEVDFLGTNTPGLFGNNGLVGDVSIDTGSGDDKVSLANFISFGNTTIDTGAGNDTVIESSWSVTPAFGATTAADWIYTGAGRDTVTLISSSVNDNLNIDTGAGDDAIVFAGMRVGHDAIINTEGGNDTVTSTAGFSVANNLDLDTGDGNDTVTAADYFDANSAMLDLGSGNDVVQTEALGSFNSYGDVTSTWGCFGGNGDDSILFTNDCFFIALNIDTGNGNDTVVMGANFFGLETNFGVNVNTGNGNDRVDLAGPNFIGTDFTVDLGNGNDQFRYLGADGDPYGLGFSLGIVERNFTIDMGKGNDTALLTGNDAGLSVGGHATFIGGEGHDSVTGTNRLIYFDLDTFVIAPPPFTHAFFDSIETIL